NLTFFFFFQAEDGILYFYVTGVQTCALPISYPSDRKEKRRSVEGAVVARVVVDVMLKPEILDPQGQAIARKLPQMGFDGVVAVRSEERRVGKECRCMWAVLHSYIT